jgi:serine/threonine protein kinase
MDPGARDEPTPEAQDLLVRALGVPEDRRAGWIRASGAAEADRDAALAMLAALDRAGARVDGALAAVRGELEGSLESGDGSVGRYVLLQPIGAGAFGDVFLGQQRSPVRRLVAVKVLRESTASPLAAARMRAERQLLAGLDHPGIAAMLDSGELPDGRPWFAMAFVAGLPVTDFARERGLGVRERVALAMQACEAVEHAHRRGVIHRDLKPANVLVSSDDDGRPRVRIIDFGVAKALDAAFAVPDARTFDGSAVGTPEYMAPEQADGAPPDTANDSFSIGCVLHELLADRPPRDPAALRARGRAGLAAAIRSARVDPPSLSAPAGRRVDRDLDAVCACATAADPAGRYATVADLREDLARWTRGDLPLAARATRARAALRCARSVATGARRPPRRPSSRRSPSRPRTPRARPRSPARPSVPPSAGRSRMRASWRTSRGSSRARTRPCRTGARTSPSERRSTARWPTSTPERSTRPRRRRRRSVGSSATRSWASAGPTTRWPSSRARSPSPTRAASTRRSSAPPR